MMTNYIGNGSTIIKTIAMAIAGQVVGVLAANGLDLGVNETQLAEIIGLLLGIAFAYIDAKYPNTFAFLGNDNPDPVSIDSIETVLNDEYELAGDDEDGGC